MAFNRSFRSFLPILSEIYEIRIDSPCLIRQRATRLEGRGLLRWISHFALDSHEWFTNEHTFPKMTPRPRSSAFSGAAEPADINCVGGVGILRYTSHTHAHTHIHPHSCVCVCVIAC